MLKNYRYLIFVMLVSASCSFNRANDDELTAGISEKRFGVHKVTLDNETPRMISEWYTGSAGNWVKFFVMKKTNSTNKYLPKGSEVYIPSELVKERHLLSEEFAKGWLKSNRVQKSAISSHPSSGSHKQSQSEKEFELERTENDTSADEIEEQLIENLVGK